MIRCQRLDARPEQFPRLVGVRKVEVTLAMQPCLLLEYLNTDGPEKLAIVGFNHLKFRQAFFQFISGQKHGSP